MEWINVKDRQPEVNSVFPKKSVLVLVVLDYTKWGREKRVELASVHYADKWQQFGGPSSLTGSGHLKGIYYAIPSICHPEAVTHWMPLPEPPKTS